ncbi:gluconokinase [Microbacterium sp. SSM24]|uniref:gluconokinase n=1 Tax=Microbacterium sp. SSM24 TaxID=2991714 RepID=UPI002225F3F9|nr:gluconokinase [Microbacterium sp. SSM24]MCW3493408.1 gluconokinase [Microbacterium sp. SSM24]
MPIVVMGVSGSGKSTVAAALAGRVGGVYLDADDFHPPANVAKMTAGIPLTDEDRMPWLALVAEAMVSAERRDGTAVVACSALRRTYRDALRAVAGDVFFVQLDGSPELLAARIGARADHFMPSSLLASQLALLEPLESDERGAVVSIDAVPADVVASAHERWADAADSDRL